MRLVSYLLFSLSSLLSLISAVASGSGVGSESLRVFALLSEPSLSESFLLVFGVLGVLSLDVGAGLAGAGVEGALSKLLIPNSAKWAILH